VLLVDVGQGQPGTFDPNLGKVVICDHTCDGRDDLVNLAVVETLLHAGTVFAAEPRLLPNDSPLAALYRY
jgi:hypothetical protein